MSTKGNRSSGSQHNPRGVTQGNTLVDPNTGLPIDVVEDGAGTRRLAVDANFSFQTVQAEVNLNYPEDSVHIGDPNTDNTLRIESDGSINTNVEVDAVDGDSVMVVGTEDGTPTGTQRTVTLQQNTDDKPNTDYNVITESRGMVYSGTNWDRARSAEVGNNISPLGMSAGVNYSQFRITHPVLTPERYTANLSDESGVLSINRDIANFSLQGKVYSTLTNLNAISGTGEVPYLLLKNPVGSGITVRAFRGAFVTDSTQARAVYRLYVNPTVTSDGTPLGTSNNRPGKPAGIAQAFRFPTILSNGFIASLRVVPANTGTQLLEIDHFFVLDPGFSILITVQNSVNNTNSDTSIFWVEI